MAPDSIIAIGWPSGPSGSTIDGIFPLGLILRYSGANCSEFVPMLILCTRYGRPHSSSMMETLRPVGVVQVYSSIMVKWLRTVFLALGLLSRVPARFRHRFSR